MPRRYIQSVNRQVFADNYYTDLGFRENIWIVINAPERLHGVLVTGKRDEAMLFGFAHPISVHVP